MKLPVWHGVDMGWPDCKIPGCQNHCCRKLESEYCHPHTLLLMIHRRVRKTWAQDELKRLFKEVE